MKKSRNNLTYWSGIGRFLSVSVMIFALLFLTTANYFLSSIIENNQINIPISEKSADSNEDLPVAPNSTEEKTSAGSMSIIEEYLHKHFFDFSLFNSSEIIRHKIAVTQKIELVHFKLLSPPPEAFYF